jgi:peptidoglycan/LPS O-acetylase OafA/YrhL
MSRQLSCATPGSTLAPEKRLYAALESWRGICACMVVLWHVPAIGPIHDTWLIGGSYLFTDFFFVLSGFIIFENYYDRIRNGFGLTRFMFLRFGRLYPLHVAVLAMFLIIEIATAYKSTPGGRTAFTDPNSSEGLLIHLSLLNAHGLYPTPTWNFPAWSIGAEFYTYLLFALVIRAAGSTILAMLMAMFAMAMGVLLLSGHENLDVAADLGFARCIAGFAMGALCQRLISSVPLDRIGTSRLTAPSEWLLLALVFGFVSISGSGRASFAAPLIFSVVIIVFAREAGSLSRILKTAPFRFLGTISYSIYMVHIFVFTLLPNMLRSAEPAISIPLTTTIDTADATIIALGTGPLQGTLASGLALILVILVATVAYRFVELPARRWSRRIALRIDA